MQAQRLFDTLEELSTCNATPGKGVTRFSWSEADSRARRVLERELKAIGLEPWTDGMGNLHARIEGSTGAPAVLTGSHLDTVRNGGRYDGTYGVVAALEALRSFHDEGYKPERAIEFIAFAEEEGSNFGSTCLGSKGIAGQIGVEGLKRLSNAEGSAYDALRAFGLDPDALPEEQIDPANVKAFLKSISSRTRCSKTPGASSASLPPFPGCVCTASSIKAIRITPPAPCRGAAIPRRIRRAGLPHGAALEDGDLPEDFSCTIGELACSPNVGIVVPESVTFTIDIRHVDVPVLEEGWQRIESLVRSVAESRGLDLELVRLSASGGVRTSPEVGEVFRQAAERRGVQPLFLKSGPAHDAASLGSRVPVGLLFVPSIKGLSHCPQEATAPEHLALGAWVLEDALRSLAGGAALMPEPRWFHFGNFIHRSYSHETVSRRLFGVYRDAACSDAGAGRFKDHCDCGLVRGHQRTELHECHV